jgi:hypothetical protein
MNIKKDSESPCSKKSRKGSKTVLAPTVPMVDAPTAEPDFSEPQIELTDSGVVLEPQGLESEGTLFK